MTLSQMFVWYGFFALGGWVIFLILLLIRRSFLAQEKPFNQKRFELPVRLCKNCPRSARILEQEHRLYPEAVARVLSSGFRVEGRRTIDARERGRTSEVTKEIDQKGRADDEES
jgi:hypothetical protein